MSAQTLATCREMRQQLPLFFDSELDPRQMRNVALHSARCPACEAELRALERLQETVSGCIGEKVDGLDLSMLWPAVERRLGPPHASWTDRIRLWWEERSPAFTLGGPLAVGATAAAAALALTVLWGPTSGTVPQVAAVAPPVEAERPVTIDSIDAATNVALLSEADTMVLWVDDEFAPMSMDVEYIP